jgi:hypothetical protein
VSYEHKEECDEKRHSSGHDFRLDEVRDPGHDDEHEAWKVDLSVEWKKVTPCRKVQWKTEKKLFSARH